MTRKSLNISLPPPLIQAAKAYADQQKVSLSQLIENFLKNLLKEEEIEISPDNPMLPSVGILDLPEDFDGKKAYREYLIEKHGGK